MWRGGVGGGDGVGGVVGRGAAAAAAACRRRRDCRRRGWRRPTCPAAAARGGRTAARRAPAARARTPTSAAATASRRACAGSGAARSAAGPAARTKMTLSRRSVGLTRRAWSPWRTRPVQRSSARRAEAGVAVRPGGRRGRRRRRPAPGRSCCRSLWLGTRTTPPAAPGTCPRPGMSLTSYVVNATSPCGGQAPAARRPPPARPSASSAVSRGPSNLHAGPGQTGRRADAVLATRRDLAWRRAKCYAVDCLMKSETRPPPRAGVGAAGLPCASPLGLP